MGNKIAQIAFFGACIGLAVLFLWYIQQDEPQVFKVPCPSNTGYCLEYR